MFHSSYEQELHVEANGDMDFSLKSTELPFSMVLFLFHHLLLFFVGLSHSRLHIFRILFLNQHFWLNAILNTKEFDYSLVQIMKQLMKVIAILVQKYRMVDLIYNQ